MDKLLLGRNALGLADRPPAHSLSGLFRTGSTATIPLELHPFDNDSDCSESSICGTSSRRIAMAKAVLAEACTHNFPPPQRSASPKMSDKYMNAGALGPLLALLESTRDPEKARCCLDTLAFLLLDRSNRKTVNSLDGVGIIISLVPKFQDHSIQCAALDAAVSLVKHSDADKASLWQHGTVLALINPKQPTPLLLELLGLVKKLAFRIEGNVPVQLLEPRLVAAVACLLHPLADRMVLVKALRFLHMASQCAEQTHLQGWHTAIFKIVPLLSQQGPSSTAMSTSSSSTGSSVSGTGSAGGRSNPAPASWCLLDAAMQPLLCLSDHEAFRNALFAGGCIGPLLSLLCHANNSVRLTAACIIANLAESGFSRQQLSRELPLHAILVALRTAQSCEVTVGLLYVLGRLTASNPQVVAVLRQCGAIPLLHQLRHSVADQDAAMGAQQLLELLGGSASTAAAARTCARTQAAVGPRATTQSDMSTVRSDAARVLPQSPSDMHALLTPFAPLACANGGAVDTSHVAAVAPSKLQNVKDVFQDRQSTRAKLVRNDSSQEDLSRLVEQMGSGGAAGRAKPCMSGSLDPSFHVVSHMCA